MLGLAAFVALVMGIGAVFGAMNTMYAIVSQRTREIGTLRALGFSRFSILFSFVLESVLLALIGGVLGCLLAFTMNGYTAGTGQTQSFSEMAFAFKITPPCPDLRHGLRRDDGLRRWPAAGLPRVTDGDHPRATRGVNSCRLSVRTHFTGTWERWLPSLVLKLKYARIQIIVGAIAHKLGEDRAFLVVEH